MLFSATFPDEVQDFAQNAAPEANQIFLKKEEVTIDTIKQLYLECDGEEQKYEALSALYDIMTIGQSIVFCKVRLPSVPVTSADGYVAKRHGRPYCRPTDSRGPFRRISPR